MNPRLCGPWQRWSIIALTVATPAFVRAAELRVPPVFVGTIPRPPQQDQPWTSPSTKLPTNYISAARTLFEQGLADPRGCRYREIEIVGGSVWGGKVIHSVHGWVLPKSTRETNEFAVCWNGLVYPLVSVGADADLQGDIAKLMEGGPDPWNRAYADTESASHTRWFQLKACLLLRLGKGDLALELLAAPKRKEASAKGRPDAELLGDGDPYLGLAGEWAWALFDRTIWAHMHGDDSLALHGARLLARANRGIESEADRRKFGRPTAFFSDQKKDSQPYLSFLSPLPALLADQERRVKEPRRVPVLDQGLDKFPDQAKRIAALVRDLEFVSARQWGQPGGIDLNRDPVVGALQAEGEAAVDALIDCLESDTRLTRSVSFGRDFHQGRSLHPVKPVAHELLQNILKKSLSDVASYRAYWATNKQLSLHQRWYWQLADDTAGVDAWMEASSLIVQPAHVTRVFSGWTSTGTLKPGEKPRATGESLRANANPTVAELLERRARQVFPTNSEAEGAWAALDKGCSFARALAIWEGAASVPVLKHHLQECFAISARTKTGTDTHTAYLSKNIVTMTQHRVASGDITALDDYAAWLEQLSPERMRDGWKQLSELLWQHPDHPGLQRASERFFDAVTPVLVLTNGQEFSHANYIRRPMLGVPAFQERLLRELTNTAVSLDAYGRTNGRVCDVIASQLTETDGVPEFSAAWPEDRREAAIRDIAALFRRYGKRFKYEPGTPEFRDIWDVRIAGMTFPALDHPATGEDVINARAIFTLESEGQTRLAKIPRPELGCHWIKLEKLPDFAPLLYQLPGPTNYYLSGRLWQAEEILRDGKWERYYGFVGKHRIVRVPAGEIDIPEDRPWALLTHGLDCRISSRDASVGGDFVSHAKVSAPPTVSVRLRNRRGAAQEVPAAYLQSKPVLALRRGLEIKLSRATDDEAVGEISRRTGRDVGHQQRQWVALSSRHFETLADSSTRTLESTEEFDAFELNLGDWFDMTAPGTYLLQFTFTEQDGGFAEGKSHSVLFTIAEK